MRSIYLQHCNNLPSDIKYQISTLNDLVTDVVRLLPIRDSVASTDMFDVRYQLRLNDLYDFSSTSIVHYQMTMQHLDFLDHVLVGEKPMRFNHLSNKLFIDMDWTRDITAGEYLIMEVFRKLNPDDIQGGTYTVTNVGSFGSVFGTPIINQPQVAILALGAVRKVPAVIETPEGDFIGIRQKMFLSHSYDHRVVNGALGGQFVKAVADYLEAWDVNREI